MSTSTDKLDKLIRGGARRGFSEEVMADLRYIREDIVYLRRHNSQLQAQLRASKPKETLTCNLRPEGKT